MAAAINDKRIVDIRLKEISRLGFSIALVPKGQAKNAPDGLDVKEAASIREALQILHLS